MMQHSILLLSLATLAAGPALAGDCRHTEPYELELEVADAAGVRIDAAAGFLEIKGREDLDRVIVRGTACAETASDLSLVSLDLDRRGSQIHVRARISDNHSWRSGPYLDLAIQVPQRLALEVDDGSGAMEIFDVGSIEIEDGSGEIYLERTIGDVRIEDGSGGIHVRDAGGLVLIARDGSGEIDVRGAAKDVEIRSDGSGGIDISDVKGSVWIGSDGSGGIRAENVAGDFVVRSDGSGGVSFDRIGGRIEIP